uniref:Uncharacterized protein n=1 Tax=Arsenophonus endosymbiont of Trialeurodes vaporariorum TaxID=235567 RepID=A0A3B0MFU6_9GAMM
MIDTKLLRQEQTTKAKQIILTDNFATPNLIAGADVGFEEKGTITRAANGCYALAFTCYC